MMTRDTEGAIVNAMLHRFVLNLKTALQGPNTLFAQLDIKDEQLKQKSLYLYGYLLKLSFLS